MSRRTMNSGKQWKGIQNEAKRCKLQIGMRVTEIGVILQEDRTFTSTRTRRRKETRSQGRGMLGWKWIRSDPIRRKWPQKIEIRPENSIKRSPISWKYPGMTSRSSQKRKRRNNAWNLIRGNNQHGLPIKPSRRLALRVGMCQDLKTLKIRSQNWRTSPSICPPKKLSKRAPQKEY